MTRICIWLVCCAGLAGCAESAAGPQLPVQQFTTWSLPPSGSSIPAPRAAHATAAGDVFVLDNAGPLLVFDAAGLLRREWTMPEFSVGKPEKIVLLRDGRLAVADTHYHRVVLFHPDGQVASMFGSLGRGPGEFIYTVAVVEDDEQNLYVCEYGDNDRIQKFDRQGKFLLQFGRPGTEPGEFLRPSGVVWHDGRLYVADAFNDRIQVFSGTGEFLRVLGNEDLELQYPYDIALGPTGDFFIAEYKSGRVTRIDIEGNLLGRYGSIGSEAGQFTTPWGLTVDRQGRVFVADTGNRRMVRLDL